MLKKRRVRINTLQNENDTLQMIIKDELYKIFMEKLNETVSIKRYRTENQKLRKDNRKLKQKLKVIEKRREKEKCKKKKLK